MIGRSDQLAEIRRHIQSTISGTARANVLFVTGEAGIGKSTLLAAVTEECARFTPAPLVATAECSTPLVGQDIGEVESLEPAVLKFADGSQIRTELRHVLNGLNEGLIVRV